MLYEILTHLATVAGGLYVTDGSGMIQAYDLLGMMAGCGTLDGDMVGQCVSAAIESGVSF